MFQLAVGLLLATAAVPDADDPVAVGDGTQMVSPRDGDDDDDEGKAQPNTAVVIKGRRLDVARTQINPELGATVYSLGNDAIDDRPGGETTSMANMLSQFPGVYFSGETLTMRGSKDTQVRINDVIVPEAISDPADHLSTRLAQSIRVMTGTLPAQYGFVPGGVISVTTKSGLYRHGGEIEGYAGSDRFIEPAVEWAGSVLGTSIFGSGSYERRSADVADLAGNEALDKSHELEGLAFADHLIGSADRVSLILGGSHEHHAIGATSLPRGAEEAGDAYAVGTYQHTSDGFTVQASMFFGRGVDEAEYRQSTTERRSGVGTQIDASYGLTTSHTLRAGILFSHLVASETQPSGTELEASRDPLGVYAQDEWKLSPTLTFNPGIRVDWLRGLGSKAFAEPRASLVWNHPAGLSAHVGYSRYAATAPLGDDEVRQRLPDEHDDYLDAGLQYHAGAVALGADVYLRRSRNLLLVHREIGSAVQQSFAFEKAMFRGLELSAGYGTHSLSAWLNVSFSRAKARNLRDDAGIFSLATIVATQGHWVPLSSDRPMTGSMGLTWRRGKLAVSGTAQASSGASYSLSPDSPNGARNHAYAVVGLSAVYHAGLHKRMSDFRVDITNLTGAHYRQNDAANLEGGWTRWGQERSITLGIEQGF